MAFWCSSGKVYHSYWNPRAFATKTIAMQWAERCAHIPINYNDFSWTRETNRHREKEGMKEEKWQKRTWKRERGRQNWMMLRTTMVWMKKNAAARRNQSALNVQHRLPRTYLTSCQSNNQECFSGCLFRVDLFSMHMQLIGDPFLSDVWPWLNSFFLRRFCTE